MEHEEVWTRGPVLDGLHPRNRLQTVPGRGHLRPATPLVPLHGPELSDGGSGEGAYRIPT